jgi:hypothetical protein
MTGHLLHLLVNKVQRNKNLALPEYRQQALGNEF